MQKHSIGKYISSIYRYQNIFVNHMFEKYGFGSGQYIFLLNIAKNPGVNQKELSELLIIDRANTHRAIKKLEELGYIHTERDEHDKRNIKSYLTPKAEELMPMIKNNLKDMTETMLNDFTEEQRDEIFVLLNKIEHNLQKYVQDMKESEHHEK